MVTVLAVAMAIAMAVTWRRSSPPAALAPKPILPAPPSRPFLRFISLSPDDTFKFECLDAGNLTYFRPSPEGSIIWRLPVDTGGPPQPFVREGFSPAVVR